MQNDPHAFQRRLAKVRRRWKAATALDGALVVATEAFGLFLVFMLADAIYSFSGMVRLGMLSVAAAVLAAVFVRRVAAPLFRRIPDEQIALYIEERSPRAEGSVISALECQQKPRGGLSGFIATLLVGDAVHRIDETNSRAFANLARLRKHLLAALGLLTVFVLTSITFPQVTRAKGERILVPWESIRREREEAQLEADARIAHERFVNRPIEIHVQPRGLTLLRGKGIEFTATLSRDPLISPVFIYQFAGAQGKEHAIEMEKAQARFGFRLPFRDINESFTYHVTACGQASEKYEIKVYDPLAVRGIELTYHYPSYLGRDPQTSFGPSGDVTALAGTRVDVRIVANNPLKGGTLRLDGGTAIALKPIVGGASLPRDNSATASFAVEKDGSYTYEITDTYGETYKFPDFFFIKAVPDKPPAIAMVAPKVDMSVHPLCEITFAAKASDDFAIKAATAHLSYYRDGKAEPMPLAMLPTTQKDFRNFLDGRVEHVLELEKVSPAPKIGDMIFYYLEITDQKGQAAKTDLFFIKLMPLEVAASWPAAPTAPDLPHWDYLWTPDIILLAAAAWHVEQQRGKIPTQEFQAQCTELAGRMEPALNSQKGLNLLGSKRELPKHIREAAAPVLAAATEKLHTALDLVREFEPGKAALEMQQAMAMAESINVAKAIQELELATAPIHTGQPSGGYNQDAVMEQADFRLPEVMSDSLTAFQQEDNPRHFKPPDYRRALRLKERTAPLTKELALAGEIYASQEQLIEMAREAFGHRKLREAAEMSCTTDPSVGGGTKGDMIRIDKRAIPYASMDPRADLPDVGHGGEMKKAEPEKLKGLRYARLRDNERAGPSSPHRSQTPGGGASEPDDEPKEKSKKKLGYTDEQWKVEANDRRPPPSQAGGGGGESQQQQPPQPGMEQQNQPGGGSSSPSERGAAQQLAARQQALADRAAQLARDVARGADPANPMGERAAGGLRDASREMRQAADSFQRGDLQAAIAQARRAQQAMRSAMHGLKAAQFESLGEALAAAQQGASALAQNQSRVSQGTRQIEDRIRELSGEAGEGAPGKGQPGKGEPGKGVQGKGAPGKGTPGKGEPGHGEPGKADSTTTRTSGKAAGPSRGAVEKAKSQDPRIAGHVQGLAGEQLKLSEAVKEFDAYVSDLAKWAKETQEERLTSSLRDVTDGLKQDDVAQKMVDAGVDLSQDNIGSARATQEEIEGALGGVTGRLRDAGDVLAGSKTGIIGRAARQAKEIGERVRQIAGLPSGQPSQGQPGTGESASGQPGGGEPGKGQPSQSTPGKGEPGKGASGKGEPGKSAPGKGQPSEGPPGKGEPGKGEPGKGEPGKGEPGKGELGKGEPGKGEPGKGTPGKGTPGQREDSLAQRLADAEKGEARGASTPGTAGLGSNVGGGAGPARDDVDQLWLKARDLADTLRDEQLAEPTTLDYIDRRVQDPESFRRMFDKVRQAEAGKFASVVTGVGKGLDEVLKETLSAKRLHAERREECPPQYRSFVDAYFESLSKAATGKP